MRLSLTNQMKCRLLLSEFPWLSQYVDFSKCWYVPKVQRVGQDLVNRVPSLPHWSRGVDLETQGHLWCHTRFLLLDADGGLLREVKGGGWQPNPHRRWWNPLTWLPWSIHEEGETIFHALGSMLGGTADLVEFILYLDLFPPKAGSGCEICEVIIYKKPARQPLSRWLHEEMVSMAGAHETST